MIGIRPPEVLALGLVTVYTYSLCILIGIVAGYYVCRDAAKRAGISADALQLSLLYGIVPGVIGARLYHVLDQFPYYAANPAEIIAIWHGGLAILGGLAGGIFGLWLFARQRRLKLLTVLDVWAPGVLLAQAIGRIGNWANQEAYGPASTLPWAIEIDEAHRPANAVSTTFHPAFLYELTWDLLGLTLLLAFRRRLELAPGRVLGAYLVIYGSGRFLVEFFRFDTAELFGAPLAQLVAVGMVSGGCYLLLRPSANAPTRGRRS